MKRFLLFCFVVSFLFSMQNTYADETLTGSTSTVVTFDMDQNHVEKTTPVTIKQMKENLEGLKDEKEDISEAWNSLNQINGKVVDFLKADLTKYEINQIQTLSIAFQIRKEFYETQLKNNSEENYNTSTDSDKDTAAIKRNFINYKLNFYKELVPYIDITKKISYLAYIKGNLEIEKEDKNIKEKIYKQEGVIEQRVDTIKDKIKEHNELLEEKLETLITDRIIEKLSSILESKKISNLENLQKIILLTNVIDRLAKNKEQLITTSTDSELLRKKIRIYEITESIIQNKIDLLSTQ